MKTLMMKSVLKKAFFAVFLCILAVVSAAKCDKYDKVNPFIGTGGFAYGKIVLMLHQRFLIELFRLWWNKSWS